MTSIERLPLLRFLQRRRKLRALNGLKTAEQFREALQLERMRADRNGGRFCLLRIQLPAGEQDLANLGHLARLVEQRSRSTDQAGLLDDWQMAVLLPETQPSGARALAESIQDEFTDRGVDIRFEVSSYPHQPSETEPREESDLRNSDPLQPALRGADIALTQSLPVWKRGMDIAGAVFGLIIASPILLVAAAAIKLTSRGPVVFSQTRTGLGGKPFTIYKLRTMQVDAEEKKDALRAYSEQDGPAFKMKDDPRVTRVGHYLRKTCIDELPQLWNVLRGEMSLVGPRPLPAAESEQCLNWQRRRLHTTPGLTCIWQVSGGMRVSFLEWMRMDIRYIQRRCMLLDLKLLVLTFFAVALHRAST